MTQKETETGSHHEADEKELARLENEASESREIENSDDRDQKKKNFIPWLIALSILGIAVLITALWILNKRSGSVEEGKSPPEAAKTGEHGENESGEEVTLDPELLESAGIETEAVTQRPAIAKLYVTGTVELNPEKTEMATPLVGGRLEKVFFGVGDYVEQGAVMAVLSSPQLAQMHGKMHEARTRYELAQRNLSRVQRSENRVAVLQSKAKLDEADSTLKRTRRLIELGAGAGKDLISAETNYKTAKADYDFQSNISLNKEIQEAKAEVETSRVDLRHIEDEMRSLGVIADSGKDDHNKNTSLVSIRAPLSGVVTERKFNAGAGVEASTPVFAISNLSTVYVIANVPEASIGRLTIGSTAEIRSESIGTINGLISYIDPRLDETTRTARVRLEVSNPGGKLRAGMFTEVGFNTGTGASTGLELVIPTEAIQREGEKTIVFVPKENELGAFEVRTVEIGDEIDNYTSIKSGVRIGEKVVTKGSFALKTQMMKGEMGEHGH
jgi:membrane fusion protein, heavy metal efflux system